VIHGKRILAIITARGGSKGIPGKNIRPLAGKPLIGWTIEAARQSQYIDRVIVSSDSAEILDVSRQFGAETPFARPAYLATDLAKQEDALLHAMHFVEQEEGRGYDYMMLLIPTHPLRDAAEIDAVVETMAANPKARSVLTVIECQHHPLFSNKLPADRSMKDFIAPELRTKNRQELPTYYQLSASVCLIEWQHFIDHETVQTDDTYAHLTTVERGLDIDNLIDFDLAELYMHKRLAGGRS
jgi:CMP-N,N'-diacetyllegionaminic acid synthase